MRPFSQFISQMQVDLFPALEETFGGLTRDDERVVAALEVVQIERFVPPPPCGLVGRPEASRRPIARALVAKAVLGLNSTRALLGLLATSASLRKICGWDRAGQIPSEATFSRAFDWFASSELPQRIHNALVKELYSDRLVGHVSRDSTAIEAPERPRSRSGKKPKPKTNARLRRQLRATSIPEMIADLPTHCTWGCKKNSRGHLYFWGGYKLHADWTDHGIPVSCLLTSASLHDSQVAIPLAATSALRVSNCYDLMDSAYDSDLIRQHSRNLGHVPIIEINDRGSSKPRPPHDPARKQRLRLRSAAERGAGRLKESFGARYVRVRGAAKVMAHIMFGVLALIADQILRLAT